MSEFDLKKLALAIEILKDPTSLIRFKNCMKKSDTYTYLCELTSPAHHFGKDCDRLWRIFPNYEILCYGEKAKEEQVKKIREIYKQHPYLIDDLKQFEKKIVEDVGKGITLESVPFRTKGDITFSAINTSEIAQKIRNLIYESEAYYLRKNGKTQRVIGIFWVCPMPEVL